MGQVSIQRGWSSQNWMHGQSEPGQPFFSDNFDSGNLNNPTGPGTWGTWNSGVTSDNPRSGSYSVRLKFNQKPPGDDCNAELQFNLNRTDITELWCEYYLYIPDGTEGLGTAAYKHRLGESPNNNKFLRLWGESYADDPKVGASCFDDDPEITGRLKGEYKNGDGLMGVHGNVSIHTFYADKLGLWTQVRWHFKMASGYHQYDGVGEFWFTPAGSGTTHYQIVDEDTQTYGVNLWTVGGNNYWRNGYFMGWANTGFDQLTYVWIDDVSFYDTDPGW